MAYKTNPPGEAPGPEEADPIGMPGGEPAEADAADPVGMPGGQPQP